MSAVADAPPRTDEVAREVVEQVGVDRVLGEVRRNCFIIYVTVRAWRGRYLLRGGSVTVDGTVVDSDLVTNGQWKVVPPEWHRQLQPFESQARAAVYKVGTPFKDGVYIVPKSRAADMVARLKQVRAGLKAKVEQFAAEWPALVEKLQTKVTDSLGAEQWLALSSHLPSAAKLSSLYDIEIGLWPVGGAGGEGLSVEAFEDLQRAANMLDAVDGLVTDMNSRDDRSDDDRGLLREFAAAVRRTWNRAQGAPARLTEDQAEAWVADAQQVTNRMVAQAVQTMVDEPVREFVEQVNNLTNLAAGRTVRTATLDAIRRAYDKLRGFSFMLPEELVARLTEVDLQLGMATPQSVNGQSVAAGQLTAALRTIGDELASDAGRVASFKQMTRHLDL